MEVTNKGEYAVTEDEEEDDEPIADDFLQIKDDALTISTDNKAVAKAEGSRPGKPNSAEPTDNLVDEVVGRAPVAEVPDQLAHAVAVARGAVGPHRAVAVRNPIALVRVPACSPP